MKARSKLVLVVGALAGATVAYLTFGRRSLNRWGATEREVEMSLPGDELAPPGFQRITHVIDIEADVEQVWPWLLQIGQGRAGFYSYSWLENLLGSEVRNVKDIREQFQSLREGDVISLHPSAPPLRVVDLDPPQNLVLTSQGPVDIKWDGTIDKFVWSFHIRPHGRGSCRLIARARVAWQPNFKQQLSALLLEPGHFLLERKMMLTLKALAERASATGRLPNPTVL